MQRNAAGYYELELEGVRPDARYSYRIDGERDRPDPASRFQPQGVHGPSQIVDPGFPWEDQDWRGLRLADFVLYELHVGTFTPEGTLDAVIPYLDGLKSLGVTALELMPVAQFPGSRNWGYDGTHPFAVQNSYGGQAGLKRLVNACHRKGLAVVLDVMYNHLGPEGNYLAEFGPYFTDRYRTPWGSAVNFDGPDSDEVRRFFIENALHWTVDFHIDALRLDAVHAIVDHSAVPFLQELGEAIHHTSTRLGRPVYVIPESSLNDSRLIRPRECCGLGLDAQWNDDFHHSLRTLLTKDRAGYYQDFGRLDCLVKAYREGFVYSGEYSAYRRRRHGNSSRTIPAHRFVVFSQNHDQVGNHMLGERLTELIGFEGLKLAAGAVLLSPFIPLLFMGEEYGETAPFQYFVSHADEGLIEAVRRGRKKEFEAFAWHGEPPDPQEENTFRRCKLNHELCRQGWHRVLLDYYKELIRLRRAHPALAMLSKDHMEVGGREPDKVVYLRRWCADRQAFILLHFNDRRREVRLPVPSGWWAKVLDSAEKRWLGRGSSIPSQAESRGEITAIAEPWQFAVLICGEPAGQTGDNPTS
jgi:maltooligosyltrehalose trehalohydrolase